MRRAPRRFYFHLSGALDLFRFGVSHLAHSFSFRFRIALRRGTQPRTSLPESRQFLPDFFSLPLGGFASPRSLRDFPRRLFRFRPEVRPAPLHRNICNHTKNDRKIRTETRSHSAGASSSSSALRRRWIFQNQLRNLARQNVGLACHFLARDNQFLGNLFLRRSHFLHSAAAHHFQKLRPLVESYLPRGFLLRVNFSALFFHLFVIRLQILGRIRFDRAGLHTGAFNLRVPLRHPFLNRREERPAHEQIEKKNNDH